MNRRWLINRTNPEYIRYLSRAASVSPVLSQILINRGIKTPGDVNDFLCPGISSLSDPFGLPGMKPAVERIRSAISSNERILIHGDYDADGVTATAIMVSALRTSGADVSYFIPNRMTHGYGFNVPSVGEAKKLGIRLIITVDCGITAFEAAQLAKKSGIDLIITDHHEPMKGAEPDETKDFIIPEATAVINPKLRTQDTALSHLSGAGIAFKTAQALASENDLPLAPDDSLRLLDLAALGTLADIVPLTGENRAIIKEGLKHLASPDRPGIKALKEVSGINGREIKTRLLLFTLVPRINAAGRIADASGVVDLLLSGSYEEALPFAEKLDRTNKQRQQIEEEVYQEALAQLNLKGHDAAIVLCGRNWHAGVTGIVASRLAEEFYKPAFVLTEEDGTAKGSARSIPAFDLYNGLSSCKDLLLSYGGHKQAAGLRLSCLNMPFFEDRINALVKGSIKKEDLAPVVEIDSEVNFNEVNEDLANELSRLEPLGFGNTEPVLGARGLGISNPRIVGGRHLKMRLKKGTRHIDAIGFDMAGLLGSLDSSPQIDAAFTPAMNEWNNCRQLQLSLRALRFSSRP